MSCAACRRDEALAAIQESISKQQQQELAIETEIQGYKKDVVKEQVRQQKHLTSWQPYHHLHTLCACFVSLGAS